MDKDMLYRCVECSRELIAKRYGESFERVCSKCGGHMKPIRVAVSKKLKNTVTVGIEMVGYEKMKGQLRNLEAIYDRILEKQKLIDKGSNRMYDADEWKRTMVDGRWAKDHELLQRIDTDCGRIVRALELNKPKTINITIDGKTASAITDDYNKSYNEYCKKYCNR